ETKEDIRLRWIYNRDLFDARRIEQMALHYRRVLEQVVADPNRLIDKITLLTTEERSRILKGWNNTKHRSTIATIPELFEKQVERMPEAVALVYEGQELSYGELNRRAHRLRH